MGVALALLGAYAVSAPLGFGWFTLGLYTAGLLLFLVAKASNLRRGIRVSFGSDAMSPWNRRAYRVGYLLMAFGGIATVAFFVALGASSPS